MLNLKLVALVLCVSLVAPAQSRSAELALRLASLDTAEVLQEPSWGDRMTVTRPFGPWTLVCELSVSQNRRLCSVEQSLKASGGAIYWKLGQAEDDRTVLIFSLPANMDTASGLTLRFGDIRADVTSWACSDKACIALVPLNKTLEALLLNNEGVDLVYQTKAGAGVTLASDLSGLQLALKAAANDPFGKQAPVRKAVVVPIPSPRPNMIAMQESSRAGQ